MKKIIILFVLLFLFSACKAQPDSSTSTESHVSPPASNASNQSEINDRPLTQKIPALIEGGEAEWLTANLETGSNGKYTIYIFDDPEHNIVFEFKTGDNGDLITPQNHVENSPNNRMYMRIVSSDGSLDLPETSKDEDGFTIEYSRIIQGDDIFDVEIYYWNTPLPNPVTLMRSMLDTLVINEMLTE